MAKSAERLPQGRPQHSLAYEWAIVTAAATLIAFVLVAGSWTLKLDQVLYDEGLALQERPARNDVVIVAIDDESLAAKGPWPWRRADVATLVNRISDAKPKALAIDLLFAEPDYRNPGDDKLLANALEHEPHTVLPVLSVQGRELVPIQSLAENARLASVSITLDPDGVLRRVVLPPKSEAGHKLHIAQAMLQLGGFSLADFPVGDFPIPFIGPPGKVKHVSAAALLNGEVPSGVLKDKFVLLGITAKGLADSYATPSTAGSEQMAGIEVSANILTALLDGRQIQTMGKYSVGFLSAVAMLFLLIIFYRVGPSVSLYLMFAAVFLTPVLALILLGYPGIWFPPMSVAISALIAYPLWHWKRLEAICHYLDEEIVRLEQDQNDGLQALPSGTVGFADYIQNRIELIRVNINYLRAARKFISESLDGLPFAALIVAPDGQLVVANRQALALCQLDKPDLSKCNIETALAGVRLEDVDWLQAVAAVLDGNKLELKASNDSGSEFEVALASFRNDQGIISGLIVVVEDVTALRMAQREREDALSFLSHDIRSPQNSIIALAELQRHEATRKPEPQFVADVEALAQKTTMLAEDFLQLVRADSKSLNLAEYDLSDMVEDCIAEIEPQATAKKITIQFSVTTSGMAIMADRSLMVRAIGNLLTNAVKFTSEGGRVIAGCEVLGAELVCSIADTGPGIQESDLPRLFKRFSRVHNGESRISGSGLGLVFVDVVARRHGGRVNVRSVHGQGAVFSIALPRVSESGSEA